MVVLLVVVAGLSLGSAAVAAQNDPASRLEAFQGEALGTGYSVEVSDGPGIFRAEGRSGCEFVALSTDDSGAQGCASVRGGSDGLADYGLVCETGGRFLYGLVSSTTVSVEATTSSGPRVSGRLHPLPGPWAAKARVWLLALPSALALHSIEALDGHGAVIAKYRIAAGQLHCASPLGSAGGHAHENVNWTYTLKRTRGAGSIPNFCQVLEISQPDIPFTQVGYDVDCTTAGLAGHGLFRDGAGEHSCSPSYAIFYGLVSRKVSDVEVLLEHGPRLHARLIRIPRSTHLAFDAFVAATPKNDNEVAYVLRTRSGRHFRVPIPPGPPIPVGC